MENKNNDLMPEETQELKNEIQELEESVNASSENDVTADADVADDVVEAEGKKKSTKLKMWKPVIITAIVAVVLAVATVIVLKFFPMRENIPDYINQEGETIVISDMSAKMVESIEFEPADGNDFKIVYTFDASGNQVGSLEGAGEEFKYNASSLWEVAGIAKLYAVEEIEKPEGRDDEFGFDKPAREIQINFMGNKKLELVIGKEVPKNDWYSGVYIKRVDTGRVYVVGGDTATRLMITPTECRDISLKEYYNDYLIDEISIQRPDEEKITVRRKQNVELDADYNPVDESVSLFELISPNKHDANNSAVQDRLLLPYTQIKAAELIEDFPKDLTKYGLNKPTVIEIKDKDGETHTLKVGNTRDKGGNYIMYDEIPSVICTDTPITFLNIKHTDLLEQSVWLHNKNDISSISYTLEDGSVHSVVVTDSGANYNGRNLSATDYGHLIYNTFGFTIQKGADSVVDTSLPAYTILVTKVDGNTQSLQLYKVDERFYAYSLDGEVPNYCVNKSQVSALATAINALIAGTEIPA